MFRSEQSSPFSRVANILNGKPQSPSDSHRTRVFSDRENWQSHTDRSLNHLEKKGHRLVERHLKRKVLRVFESIFSEREDKLAYATQARKHKLLIHMQNYAFVKQRERRFAQVFEQNRWSKL